MTGNGLTAEQVSVVELPVNALALVTAGPGAGKTFTMVRRLQRLAIEEDLSAADVLVLSFSRSAVRVLGERLAGSPSRPRVRTFDAWALELLMDIRPGTDWRTKTFEQRVLAAADALKDGSLDERFEHLQHVMIDEAQDLVGSRQMLVQSLLERYCCGFTIVADLAQAIYDFQAQPRADEALDQRFVVWLRETFNDELIQLELKRNFRVLTADAAIALPQGEVLRTGADKNSVYESLRSELLGVPDLVDLSDAFIGRSLTSFDGTTAILARTNGQALDVSSVLHRGGIAHQVKRGAQDRSNPAWMAELFGPEQRGTISREQFDALRQAHRYPAPAIDERWQVLLRLARGPGGQKVDAAKLRRLLKEGRFPDELLPQRQDSITVSSFHRAKGLEFDRVVVVDPGPLRAEQQEHAEEEARALFVAMTRARSEILRLPVSATSAVRLDKVTDRWARYGWKKWQRFGLEVKGRDVSSEEPAGTAQFRADPAALQRRLQTSVHAGQPVVLRRITEGSAVPRMSPHYLLLYGETPIGIMSEVFRTALFRFLAQGSSKFIPRNFPATIEDVWIDTVETVAGGDAAGAIAGLGDDGIWLAPRLTGLGRFSWDRKDD